MQLHPSVMNACMYSQFTNCQCLHCRKGVLRVYVLLLRMIFFPPIFQFDSLQTFVYFPLHNTNAPLQKLKASKFSPQVSLFSLFFLIFQRGHSLFSSTHKQFFPGRFRRNVTYFFLLPTRNNPNNPRKNNAIGVRFDIIRCGSWKVYMYIIYKSL